MRKLLPLSLMLVSAQFFAGPSSSQDIFPASPSEIVPIPLIDSVANPRIVVYEYTRPADGKTMSYPDRVGDASSDVFVGYNDTPSNDSANPTRGLVTFSAKIPNLILDRLQNGLRSQDQNTNYSADFYGVTKHEVYDVYLSDRNGNATEQGNCITIDGKSPDQPATGALNIAGAWLQSGNTNVRRFDVWTRASVRPGITSNHANAVDNDDSIASITNLGSTPSGSPQSNETRSITMCLSLDCPPILNDTEFKKVFSVKPVGSIVDPYRLAFSNSTNEFSLYHQRMSSYLSRNILFQGSRVVMLAKLERMSNGQSLGVAPSPIWKPSTFPPVGADRFLWWDKSGNGTSSLGQSFSPKFWSEDAAADMQPGSWYRTMSYYYLEHKGRQYELPQSCPRFPAFFVGLEVKP
jgi:hypothetical protein